MNNVTFTFVCGFIGHWLYHWLYFKEDQIDAVYHVDYYQQQLRKHLSVFLPQSLSDCVLSYLALQKLVYEAVTLVYRRGQDMSFDMTSPPATIRLYPFTYCFVHKTLVIVSNLRTGLHLEVSMKSTRLMNLIAGLSNARAADVVPRDSFDPGCTRRRNRRGQGNPSAKDCLTDAWLERRKFREDSMWQIVFDTLHQACIDALVKKSPSLAKGN